ncbi:MAG: hypothetical protein J6P07_08610 [Spirochaetaceae bacterium]|nr:hypothetical protein [Spirochaetaceae bacterium]MBO7136678.1 hypothetical protein [Spirochaetaceae bacterium]MBO7731904.1 hypothetical protein [Methanobrevibacter sp.]
MTDNDFREPTGMYNIPAITAQISKNTEEAKKKGKAAQLQTGNRNPYIEAGKNAQAKATENLAANTNARAANGVNQIGMNRQQNEMDIPKKPVPDREVSDKEYKDIRQKRIDHLKENWGETDEMKRQKKKKEEKGN